jgi:predicted metal-dependent hydrolase
MSKVTLEDVIDVLKQRIDKLTKELSLTQRALEILMESPENPAEKLKKKERKVIKEAKKNIKKQQESTHSAESDQAPAINGKKKTSAAHLIPYHSNLLLQDKIAYVLNQSSPATKEEILKKLKENEPDADLKKLNKAVTSKLSVLEKSGKIRVNRDDEKVTYSF